MSRQHRAYAFCGSAVPAVDGGRHMINRPATGPWPPCNRRGPATYGLADGEGDAVGPGLAAWLPCAAFWALSSAAFILARSLP